MVGNTYPNQCEKFGDMRLAEPRDAYGQRCEISACGRGRSHRGGLPAGIKEIDVARERFSYYQINSWALENYWDGCRDHGPVPTGRGLAEWTFEQIASGVFDGRTAGADPHVELRDATGQRTDAYVNQVSRGSPSNHTSIDFDL